MTSWETPPFRAEHIGSLLRPPALLKLRMECATVGNPDDALRAAEDKAIAGAVALQLERGLSSIADGEFRRSAYSDSFTIDAFDGVEISSTLDPNWTYSNVGGRITEGRVQVVVDK